MSLLISKLMYKLSGSPKVIFFIFLIITLLLSYSLPQFTINYATNDLIDDQSRTAFSFKKIQSQFHASSLIILEIDSLHTLPPQLTEDLINQFKAIPEIHSVVYPGSNLLSSHYRFLYLDTNQLITMLQNIREFAVQIQNPLLYDETKAPIKITFNRNFQQNIILITNIDEFNYSKNYLLKDQIERILNNFNIKYYSLKGNSVKNIKSTQNIIYSLVIISCLSILMIILYLIILNNFNIITPLYIIILNIISITLAVSILGLFNTKIHYLHLFILPFLFTILTFASIKLFRRFKLEVSKGLSPRIALETILLETGPTLVRSYFIIIFSFISLLTFNFYAIQELAYIGSLSTFISGFLTLGTLPWFLKKFKNSKISPTAPRRILEYKRSKSKIFNSSLILLIIIVGIFSIIGPHQLINKNYNFTKKNSYDYMIVSSNNLDTIQNIINKLNHSKLLESHLISSELIPQHQKYKIKLINDIINEILSIPKEYRPLDIVNSTKILNYDTISPIKIRQFFKLNNDLHFAYIVPYSNKNSIDHLREIIRPIYNMNQTNFSYYGDLFIIYEYVNSIISNINIWISLYTLVIFLTLVVGLKNIVHALIILSPALFSLLLLVLFLDYIKQPVHIYFVFLSPIFVALSIDSALYMFHRYIEEGRGSLTFILLRTKPDVYLCHLSLILVFACFYFSELEILQNFATVGICASVSIQICTFILIPFFLSLIDQKRWQEYQQSQRKKSLYLQN